MNAGQVCRPAAEPTNQGKCESAGAEGECFFVFRFVTAIVEGGAKFPLGSAPFEFSEGFRIARYEDDHGIARPSRDILFIIPIRGFGNIFGYFWEDPEAAMREAHQVSCETLQRPRQKMDCSLPVPAIVQKPLLLPCRVERINVASQLNQ